MSLADKSVLRVTYNLSCHPPTILLVYTYMHTCSNSTSHRRMRPSLVIMAALFSDVGHRVPENTVHNLLILRASEEQHRM